jgi:hypothetical protein
MCETAREMYMRDRERERKSYRYVLKRGVEADK